MSFSLSKTFFGAKQSIGTLAQAQARTDEEMRNISASLGVIIQSLNRLEQAQARTEEKVDRLEQAIHDLRSQTGGIGRTMAYALENEAYRELPAYLQKHHGIEIRERFVRRIIGGEEINVFATGRHNGEEVLIVGEAVTRLDDARKFGQLEKNMNAVRKEYGKTVIPLIVTHFAISVMLEKAAKAGVLVVQSFEWGA
jgi:hypothetical protein